MHEGDGHALWEGHETVEDGTECVSVLTQSRVCTDIYTDRQTDTQK